MFSLLQLIIASLLLIKTINAIEIQLLNKAPESLWIGIQGNTGHSHLIQQGLYLRPNQKKSLEAPSNWAGKFWARNECPNDRCNQFEEFYPVSIAELSLREDDGLDHYFISLVDGFNLPIAIQPLSGGSRYRYSCKKTACQARINQQCPEVLQVRNNGRVIGCKSACQHFKSDRHCCRGVYNRFDSCEWTDYSHFFKDMCPQAYTYLFDGERHTFTCKAQRYLITFGK